MKQKRRKRKSRRRSRLPEPIGKIIADEFPELMTMIIKRKTGRNIISIQSKDGIPWHHVRALLRIGHNRENRKMQLDGGFKL